MDYHTLGAILTGLSFLICVICCKARVCIKSDDEREPLVYQYYLV